MDNIAMGRALIGDSLIFHIIIVLLSIGLPFIMNILEYLAWRRKSQKLEQVVRLLSRWVAVLVVAGVMSGTIIALQFSTLWAPFLAQMDPEIRKYFAIEGYMFLIEAVFLSWYLLSQGKMSTGKHFLVGLPITLGAMGSAVVITMINAWMNNPTGIVTSTTVWEVTHSITSYFFAATIFMMGFVAWHLWKRKNSKFAQKLLFSLSSLALVLMGVLALLGHRSAVDLATTQPRKLAMIEIHDKTGPNAPLRIGGYLDENGTAQGGIVLPGLLSFLVGFSTDTHVKGLDSFSRDTWPMQIVHWLFDIKMAIIGLISLMIILTIGFYVRTKKQPTWFLKVLVWCGGVGILLVELGWAITELGRQPYAIAGQMLVADAFTKGIDVVGFALIFPILFIILIITTGFALRTVTKQWYKKEKITW